MRTAFEFSTGIAVANGVLSYTTITVDTFCRLVYRITLSLDRPHTWGRGGVEVKVKFILKQATKAQRGNRGIALLFP